MTDKEDLCGHFREIITRRYYQYAWITAGIGVICFLVAWFSTSANFVTSLSELSFAFAIGLLLRNITHRLKMLSYLESKSLYQLPELETYLQEKEAQWQKYFWIRIFVGIGITIVMFYLLMFEQQSYWTLTFSSLFIVYITAIAIIGWINFNDQLLLQDIMRSHREPHSNNPE